MELNSCVIVQKDSRIPKNKSIIDSLIDGTYKLEDANEIVIVCSLNGDLVEFNVIGSIIFELALLGHQVDEIAAKIQVFFYGIDGNLNEIIESFLSTLKQSEILIE